MTEVKVATSYLSGVAELISIKTDIFHSQPLKATCKPTVILHAIMINNQHISRQKCVRCKIVHVRMIIISIKKQI